MKIFRLSDALTFGLISLIVTIVTVYISFTVILDFESKAILYTTALSFWAIYGLLIYFRYKWLQKITYVTYHKINIVSNNFDISHLDLETIIENTISKWENVTKWNNCANALEDVIVIFKKFPISHRSTIGKLAGYTIGKNIVVGYKEDLKYTALSHELGHVIYSAWKKSNSNQEQHDFIKNNNLD